MELIFFFSSSIQILICMLSRTCFHSVDMSLGESVEISSKKLMVNLVSSHVFQKFIQLDIEEVIYSSVIVVNDFFLEWDIKTVLEKYLLKLNSQQYYYEIRPNFLKKYLRDTLIFFLHYFWVFNLELEKSDLT